MAASSQTDDERLDFLKVLEETRANVWRLMNFAIADANKDIQATRPDLLEKALPGLKKETDKLTEAEIADLFMAYNELSRLVYPATVESLWLKQKIEKDERELVLGGFKPRIFILELIGWYTWGYFLIDHFKWPFFKDMKKPRESSGNAVKINTGWLKFLLYSLGLLMLFLQGYNLALSYGLEAVEKQKLALDTVDKEIAAAETTLLATHAESEEPPPPLRTLLTKRDGIILALNNDYCAMRMSSWLWQWRFPEAGIDCKTGQFSGVTDSQEKASWKIGTSAELQARRTSQLAEAIEQQAKATTHLGQANTEAAQQLGEAGALAVKAAEQQFNAARKQAEAAKEYANAARHIRLGRESQANGTREAFFTGIMAAQRVLNYLLLPTLLGFLGALAFVIRDLLKNYSESSYVIGCRRTQSMRIALGPLLGLISGIIAYPSRTTFTEASFSPLVLGLLMGYSVEFAFSLFDTLITKAKSFLPDTLIQPKPPAAASVPSTPGALPVPQVSKLKPVQGPASGGNEVILTGSGFGKDPKVRFGSVAATVNSAQDTQIVALAPSGQGTVNVTVQTAGGTSPPKHENQYTYQAPA